MENNGIIILLLEFFKNKGRNKTASISIPTVILKLFKFLNFINKISFDFIFNYLILFISPMVALSIRLIINFMELISFALFEL